MFWVQRKTAYEKTKAYLKWRLKKKNGVEFCSCLIFEAGILRV